MSSHLIMSLMLQISSLVDEVIEEYQLNLPNLNLSTIEIYKSSLGKIVPATELSSQLTRAVDYYEQLNAGFR